ncbi:MAG: PHB depolymerase family esterase [Thermomicrobiales bacterium]
MRARSSFIIALMVTLLGLVEPMGTSASARLQGEPTGTFDQTLTVGGVERTYRVHVPGGRSPELGFPVLFVLHGGGGNAKQVERSTGFSELADREGFIVVYPNGSGRFPRRLTWNAHNCCAYAYEENIDDVSFISALIDRIVADYHADSTRIYITGHSNGAMMTFRIACELSEKIAAAAPNAGALNTDSCQPVSPVAMLIMNGEDDTKVPVAGGTPTGSGPAGEYDRVDTPTSFAVDTWVRLDGCPGPATVVETPSSITRAWSGCEGGSEVEQVIIRDWEHSWPSAAEGAPIDGAQVIWDFVSRFSKAPA